MQLNLFSSGRRITDALSFRQSSWAAPLATRKVLLTMELLVLYFQSAGDERKTSVLLIFKSF